MVARFAPGEVLPTGTLSLLFTDIEGSTRLLQDLGADYDQVLTGHQKVLWHEIISHGGHVVDEHGDSVFAVFERASDGVTAAVCAQRALAATRWPRQVQVRVRMGLHTGEPRLVNHRYTGLDVHRAARISATASGGQVLLSQAVRDLLDDQSVPEGVAIRDLGPHHLKDLRYPEHLFDLRIAGLPEPAGGLRTMTSQPNNLPVPPTLIIGRVRELKTVTTLFGQDPVRLVTLTGPGGVGKSRLALEIARSLIEAFPDGVFRIDLAAINDPRLVASSIAQALSAAEFPGLSPLDALKNRLGMGQILLLLDNFEQVIEAAGLVADLLASCPSLKMLITSREALNIRFEHVFEVPGLALPDEAAKASPAAIGGLDSVRLFVERVRDFRHDFALDADNAAAVGEICRRLDGLPLAIELAASQVKLFSPQALLGRLDRRLDVLKRGSRDLDARHQTLRDTIEWSYNLLTPDEQHLFEQAAVFAGGFDTASACSVCDTTAGGADAITEGLVALAAKSLLKLTTLHGEPRFAMLETVRDYGLERLRSSPACAPTRARHGAHFEQVVTALAPDILGFDQRQSVVRLFDEADNIRAALSWALEQPDAGATSRLVNGLLWLWISQGQFSEGLSWMDRAVAQVGGLGERFERALILDVAGWLRLFSGDYAGAFELCHESLSLFDKLGDAPGIARTKVTCGINKAVAGQIPEGPRMILDGLEMFRHQGDKYGTGLALIALGEGARAGGDEQAAAACHGEALGLLREIGNAFWVGGLLHNLAHCRLHQGDWRAAAGMIAEAIEIGQAYNYPVIMALCVSAAGAVALAKDRPTDAAALFGASQGLMRALGARFEPADLAELDRNTAAARTALGERAYESAFESGAGWSREDAAIAARTACA